VNSNLGQEVEENYLQKNDKPITIRSSTNLNTEQVATKDSTPLSTQKETVMNDMHKNTEQTEIMGSGCETELSDTQNADKDTEISTLHYSDMKQRMADQTHIQIPTTNSELCAENSEISDSIPHEPELPVTVPQDCCTLTEHNPVLLGTASQYSSEKSDMVSWQFDNCDAGFPLPDSASHMPNMAKPEMGELKNKAKVQKENVS
jgi:hypothetical protein